MIGQNGLADAQLGPSINLATARWTAQWYGLVHSRVAPTRIGLPGDGTQKSEERIQFVTERGRVNN